VDCGEHKLFRRFILIFAIFYRNFSQIVAPSNNRNENYAVHLKELSLLKKNGVKLVEIGH